MKEYISTGCYLYKFDIRAGYYHIEIGEGHQTYLGFSWTFDGVTKSFVFLVLPFGITSPFVFTKVMRDLIKYWRSLNIKIGCFLDDGLGMTKRLAIGYKEAKSVRDTLILQASLLITKNLPRSLFLLLCG